MKKVLACLIFLFVFGTGCTNKKVEIELTKDRLSRFKAAEINQVKILTTVHTAGGLPYSYEFYITTPEQIRTIIDQIRNAKQIKEGYESDLRQSSKLLVFESPKGIYSTKFNWNNDVVYGTWWESAGLLEKFEEWNLFEEIAHADPKWSDPEWMIKPSPESDPNFPPNQVEGLEL